MLVPGARKSLAHAEAANGNGGGAQEDDEEQQRYMSLVVLGSAAAAAAATSILAFASVRLPVAAGVHSRWCHILDSGVAPLLVGVSVPCARQYSYTERRNRPPALAVCSPLLQLQHGHRRPNLVFMLCEFVPFQGTIFLESYNSVFDYPHTLTPPSLPLSRRHHFQHNHGRWEEEQVRRGATRPAAKPKRPLPSTSPWGGGTAIATVNGGSGTTGASWGGTAGERPRFLGIKEMQKALREAATQLRDTHERNERQLQVVSE